MLSKHHDGKGLVYLHKWFHVAPMQFKSSNHFWTYVHGPWPMKGFDADSIIWLDEQNLIDNEE
jgi:hypothetical protein